jgi:AcrR family transcriptional regulator
LEQGVLTFPDTGGGFVQERLVIPGASDDVRGRRSRDELAWALVALMRERPYDDIGVRDICERAGIGRSTFYAHFADKDDMFVRHVVVFAEWMGQRLSWSAAAGGYRFDLRFLLEHVRDMRPVYESLMRSRKVELITKVWQNNFAVGFERCIVEVRRDAPQPLDARLLAQHIAGTVINLMQWWLDHHCTMEPAQVDEQFHRLIAHLR